MSQSSQKFIARNRAPRVQIEYDVDTYGSEKKVQLPFVMAVLADLSGKSERRIPDVAQRRFAEIDIDNFDERVKALAPRVAFSFLRRGKRTLHGLWDGEEVLARRADGALQFDWELVGQRGNVARPSWMEIGLRTRVADNKVGAARTSAISEEQAVELWERLLEGVKFRVAVPGATAASVALA